MGWLGDKYKQYQDAKHGRNPDGSAKYSEEDLKKYTGMDKTQLEKFGANTPGVAGNQNAGSIALGDASGLYDMGFTTYDQHKIPNKK